MLIKFPKEEERFSPQDAHIAYNHLIDYHLHFLKLQSKYEFFYWKLVGIFFLSGLGVFILLDNGIIMDPLIAITIIGFGCLLVFVQTIRMDVEYAVRAASCVESGLLIEEKHDYTVRPFRIFEDNKAYTYRGNLLSRAFPFAFIGLAALVAGSILAGKVGIWFAVGVATLIASGLSAFAKYYVNVVRKIFLGIGK